MMKQNVIVTYYSLRIKWSFFLLFLITSVARVEAMDNIRIKKVDASETGNVEEQLIRLNTEMLEQYTLHHNTQLNEEIMLDDYIFMASIGKIESKEDVINTVGNLNIRSASITYNEFRHHDPTAVLVGTLHLDGFITNTRVNARMRFMSVFVYVDDQWRLMARSFSPIVHPSVLYGEPERP
jgi:hypothetical protein